MAEISVETITSSRFSVESGLTRTARFIEMVKATEDISTIISETITSLTALFHTTDVVIYTFAIKNQKLDFKYHKNGNTTSINKVSAAQLDEDLSLVLSAKATSKVVVVRSNTSAASFTNDEAKMIYNIAIPFYYNNHILGCIRMECPVKGLCETEIPAIGLLISNHLKQVCHRAIEHRHLIEFKSRIRKLINAKVSDLEVALSKADKYNQSLKDFAYIVSHDLREPLRTINSYIKLIDRRYKEQLDSDGREFMHFVTDGVERMDSLIQDLLLFSRIENSEYQYVEVSMNDLLLKIQNSLRLKITETEAQIVYADLPTIIGSKSHLIILFQNLIDNAIKFRHPARTPIIEISFDELPEHWHFSIKDNGIGMDLAYKNHERIFKVFQRLQSFDSTIPGTGIGLSLCKNIVLNHNGKIWVKSILHQESTFHLTISKKLQMS